MRQTTLKYKVSCSKAGYRRINQALLFLGQAYNAFLLHRKAANGSHKGRFSLSLQNQAITQLRSEDPEAASYSRRLLAETAKKANLAWNARLKAAGKPPDTKNPRLHNTLAISEPANHLLRVSDDGRRATVRIKGLPKLEFNADRRLPQDSQPRIITMTRKPRRLEISLTFNLPEGPPQPGPHHSVGIDPGVSYMLAASGSDGHAILVPGFNDRTKRKTLRRLRRRMQRQRDAALRDDRAHWVTQKNKDGSTKRRFRWSHKLSNSYIKCRSQLRRVEHKGRDQLHGIQHDITSKLVKQYGIICLEDTKTSQMTRSAKGTADNPGSNVRQKAELNRSILAQGWHGIRHKLVYKCERNGRTLILVPARNTSVTCLACGTADPASRKSREQFLCASCGNQAHADLNAAENIRRRGVTAPGREDEFLVRAAGSFLSLSKEHQAPYTLPAPTAGRERCAHELEEAQANFEIV